MTPIKTISPGRRIFSKRVDKRSREEMTTYLAGHFRYNTMNSWNRSTSYACNMKLYNLGLDRDTIVIKMPSIRRWGLICRLTFDTERSNSSRPFAER